MEATVTVMAERPAERHLDWPGPTEAAARSGYSTYQLQLLAKKGAIRSVRTSIGRLFCPADLDRLREERDRKRAEREADE
jgi:hypothetical protein